MEKFLKVSFLLLFSMSVMARPAAWNRPHFCTPRDPDFRGHRYTSLTPYCERNVTPAMRARIYDAFGVPEAQRINYTVDHLVPLSLGGSNSVVNLWPQLKSQSTAVMEGAMYNKVIKGELHVTEAINYILEVKLK